MMLRSSIHTPLMRHVLWRGTFLASIGVGILLFAGIFIPAEYLAKWGMLLFGMNFLLMTGGLLPYRQLKRLEINPYKLSLDEGDEEKGKWLHFAKGNKPVFSIPWESVEGFDYIDDKKCYGIVVRLKRPPPQKVIVHERKLPRLYSRKDDLFLPYFSKRSYDTLIEYCAL